jgi:signal transduction histidine kinase
MHRSTELVGGASGTIYLWDEAQQILTAQVWASHGEWMRDGRVKLGEGLTGIVAQRREGLIVNDYRTWPHAWSFILEHTNVTAVVAEPLLYRDNLLGVIAVDDQGTGRRFTEQDRELLRLFASQAAVAIENARLYVQVRGYASELERKVEERTRELQTANTHLRAANAELEAFSYSVSHDLRNPLVSIEGFAGLLMKKYGRLLDAEGMDSLQRVLAGAQRMGELIEALLGLARVTRHPLREESVDLSALARTIVNDLRQGDLQREVEVEIPDGLTVAGDARLLRTLLDNLLGNAWKFTADRRPAYIEVGSLVGEVGGAAYFVRDNGVGFDMAEADKLFGMFQRLQGAEQFPGTGIGLATAQRIVERHGGRMWAEGVTQGGATIFFTLGHAAAGPESAHSQGR